MFPKSLGFSVTRSRTAALFLVAWGLLAGPGCTATRSVRPIGEGKWGGGLSLGGPVFTNLGAPIPTPNTQLFGRYGLNPKTDVDVGVHLPVARNFGLDAGVSHLVLEQSGAVPAVMVGGRLTLFMNSAALGGGTRSDGGTYSLAPRLYEEIQGTASWKPLPNLLLWAGLNVFAQLEAVTFRPSLLAGVEFLPIPELGLALELKQMSFLENQKFAVVNFLGPADQGALSVQLGIRFQQRSEP